MSSSPNQPGLEKETTELGILRGWLDRDRPRRRQSEFRATFKQFCAQEATLSGFPGRSDCASSQRAWEVKRSRSALDLKTTSILFGFLSGS